MWQSEAEYKRKALKPLLEGAGWLVDFHEDKFTNYYPDMSMAGRGKHIWCEVKFARNGLPEMYGPSSIRHFTAGQRGWLSSRHRAGGGGTWVLIGTNKGGHVLISGLVADALWNTKFSKVLGCPGVYLYESVSDLAEDWPLV